MKLFALLALLPLAVSAQLANPAVTQTNLQRTVCVPGWTATVRPPVSYTNTVKRQRLRAAGVPLSDASLYELDHIIPLSSGGHPRDPRNLQLQPWDGPEGAHAKDVVELAVRRRLCAGSITLAQAQSCFLSPTSWKVCK